MAARTPVASPALSAVQAVINRIPQDLPTAQGSLTRPKNLRRERCPSTYRGSFSIGACSRPRRTVPHLDLHEMAEEVWSRGELVKRLVPDQEDRYSDGMWHICSVRPLPGEVTRLCPSGQRQGIHQPTICCDEVSHSEGVVC